MTHLNPESVFQRAHRRTLKKLTIAKRVAEKDMTKTINAKRDGWAEYFATPEGKRHLRRHKAAVRRGIKLLQENRAQTGIPLYVESTP